MLDVLRTVHRLRKVEERRVQTQMLDVERTLLARRHELDRVERALDETWATAHVNTVAELAQHHGDALRLELRRRATDRAIHDESRRVDALRADLRRAQTQSLALGEAVSLHEQANHSANQRAEAGEMSLRGLQSWHRRQAS